MKASDLIALLPVKLEDMPKIATSTQEPNRHSLKVFQECIQDQAMAITSSDTLLGFLGLVLKDSSFVTLTDDETSFTAPVNPGNSPPVLTPPGTQAQIAESLRRFNVEHEEYKTFCEFKIILVSMIINNCPEKYLTSLKHPITKFRRCTPLALLTHLWTEYGTITSQDLTANYTRMTAQWNPPTPIQDLYLQLRDGREFATEGKETIDDSHLLRLCYDNISNTGLFNDALKIWRQKPDAAKTYELFCSYMTIEHDDRMRNQTTSQGAGYANNLTTTTVTDIVHKELEHFVNQMPMFQHNPPPNNTENVDPNIQQPLGQANAALTADQIKTIMKDMLQEFQPSRRSGNGNNSNNNNRNRNRPPPESQGTNDEGNKITYCWTHGITTNLRHNSQNCSRQKEGHKADVTLTNKMGGCTEICQPRK
jgi:hypothetical protein